MTTPTGTSGTTSTSTSSTTSTPTITKPVVGGTVLHSKGEVAFVGGPRDKPNAKPRSPFCYRPVDTREEIALYDNIMSFPSEKYNGLFVLDPQDIGKPGTDEYTLQQFQKKLYDRLSQTGMDSVFYFKTSSGEWRNLVQYSALFTIEEVQLGIADLLKANGTDSDDYDVQNLEWSRHLILGYISDSLQGRISKYVTAETTGPELYKRIVMEVKSYSTRAIDNLIDSLKDMSLAQFPEENVKLCTSRITQICGQL